jgi:hypothetical protein
MGVAGDDLTADDRRVLVQLLTLHFGLAFVLGLVFDKTIPPPKLVNLQGLL